MLTSLNLLNTTSNGELLLPLLKTLAPVRVTEVFTPDLTYPSTGNQNFEPLPVTNPGVDINKINFTDGFHSGVSEPRDKQGVNTIKPYTKGRYNYLEDSTSEPTPYIIDNSIEGESEASTRKSSQHSLYYNYNLVAMTVLISIFVER